ncbi:MAG: trypsin-like peptidase domain-containing protein [Planctomycetes bacterium]|nr:trypsin-like peptidase domain-containing protein [Planctomycetota bacterium]
MTRVVLAAGAIAAFLVSPALSQESPDPRRRTTTVELVEKCLPSVVDLVTYTPTDKPGVFAMGVGAGAIIHEAGYILTNDHVVGASAAGDARLSDGTSYRYRVVVRFAGEDLALLKIDAGRLLPPLPLGRSHDLMLGEPVLIIGNPHGLGHSVSTGIVSGLNRATATTTSFLPWLVQTSAEVNPGNSGGPLINALGEQIGVVVSKKQEADNIGFAISADRARLMLPRILAAEERHGFRLGLEVDTFAPRAVVTGVTAGSPAERAGVRPGDVVTRAGGLAVRQGLDFHLALVDRKAGETLPIDLERDGAALAIETPLAPWVLPTPVEEKGLVQGLSFETYAGRWTALPDFSGLVPTGVGRADRISLDAYSGARDFFGLRFSGFVRIPREGMYAFYSASDDGSRVWVADRLVTDNDGLHGMIETGGFIRLAPGVYPLVVTFFEHGGAEGVRVSYEGPELAKQEIPSEALLCRAQGGNGE